MGRLLHGTTSLVGPQPGPPQHALPCAVLTLADGDIVSTAVDCHGACMQYAANSGVSQSQALDTPRPLPVKSAVQHSGMWGQAHTTLGEQSETHSAVGLMDASCATAAAAAVADGVQTCVYDRGTRVEVWLRLGLIGRLSGCQFCVASLGAHLAAQLQSLAQHGGQHRP